jgi:hypothetical protein
VFFTQAVPCLVILICSNWHLFQEPWLLHGFDEDFYGEELRLAIVGYIRPEVIEDQTTFILAKISFILANL